MILIKKIIASLLSFLILIPLSLYLLDGQLNLIKLSNHFFMIGLVYLMITAFIAIFISGFFDNFQKNMKTVIHSRRNQAPTDYLKTSQIFRKQPLYWLITGLILLIFAFILTLI